MTPTFDIRCQRPQNSRAQSLMGSRQSVTIKMDAHGIARTTRAVTSALGILRWMPFWRRQTWCVGVRACVGGSKREEGRGKRGEREEWREGERERRESGTLRPSFLCPHFFATMVCMCVCVICAYGPWCDMA